MPADEKNEKEKALKYAYLLLSYRDRSTQEMRRRLKSKQYSICAIEQVLKQLTDRGLLDDEKFVWEYVQWSKTRKPMGRRRLQAELEKRGVDRQLVERILDNLLNRQVEEKLARMAVEQRGGKPPDDLNRKEKQKQLRRVFSHLLRRGFSRSLARRVLLDE